MGLFRSKYRTFVGTSVSRVIEDADLTTAVKTGIIGSLFNDGQLVERVIENMVTSVGIRAERMYSYGKDTYSFGLPNSTLVSSADAQAVVAAAVIAEIGAGTVINYSHVGPINTMHAAWKILVETHGYDSSTNQLAGLSASLGTPVYLKDMVPVVVEATLAEIENGSLAIWGTPANAGYTPARPSSTTFQTTPSGFVVEAAAEADYALVTYVWEVPTPVVVNGVTIIRQVLHEDTFGIVLSGFTESDYFQVKYTYAGKAGYWTYRRGENTKPTIDAVYDVGHDNLGSFFPIGYFRYNKVSMGDSPTSPEYLTSKKLFKYLGMDYDAMIAAVHENPGIADVEQAMMMMAVPASTTNALEQRYLFDFFSKLALEAGGAGIDPVSSFSSLKTYATVDQAKPQVSLVIQDARFKMAISCLGLSKKKKAGSIGPKGSYASSLVTENLVFTGEIITAEGTGDNTNYTSGMVSQSVPVSRHSYQYQLTESVYEEVQVYGMKMTYHIFGEYTAVGDEGDDILLIPLDSSITTHYSILDRETLFKRSLHYVFNSRVVTKVKWYQTGLFKAFMLIVTMIITIYAYGATWEAMITAAKTMTTQAIVLAIAIGVLKYVAAVIAIKLFVKVAGVKVAFIVVIVAALALAGMYYMLDGSAVAGAPWAQDLLTLSSNLVSGVNNAVSDAMRGLQSDALAFQTYAETQIDLLEGANKLLESKVSMSPFIIFGESPDDFYNRTVHSGNIGVVGIDAISSYVDVALTLPKLSQTLRGSFNV